MYYCKSAKSSELLCTPPSTLGENLFLYKYEADDELQRSIKLVRTSIIKGKIEKLPPPWREKISTLCWIPTTSFTWMID